MSKTSIHQKLAVLKVYLEDLHNKSRRKHNKKQSKWVNNTLPEIED